MNGTETDRTTTILADCREEAKGQLVNLLVMIDTCDSEDIQAMAVIALAAENAARTVRKLYQFNLERRQVYGVA